MTDGKPFSPVDPGGPTVATEPARRAVHLAQVRWSDPDVMGHLNHARYLSYFEDARMALLAQSPSGLAGAPGDRGYIAARVAVDYLQPVEFSVGLTLRVETWAVHLGASSWTLAARILDGERPVARAEAVMVAYSYGLRRSRPLDRDERAYWEQFLAR